MVECMGCIHMTSPHMTPDSMYTSFLLDLLCERRLAPPIDLSDGFEGGEIVKRQGSELIIAPCRSSWKINRLLP